MFNIFIILYIVLIITTPILTYLIKAPYGRYYKKNWGIAINDKFAWILMETISPISLILSCLWFGFSGSVITICLIFAWTFHYFYRALLYPLFIRKSYFENKMSLFTVCLGILFNIFNGTINGYAIVEISSRMDEKWITHPVFLLGGIIFAIGFIVNCHSDFILRKLRVSSDQEYEIPTGGMFKFLSSPNYFGEIIEWFGYAIASWNVASLCFALFTLCFLLPRAISHHSWYKDKFPQYPRSRKAIIPFIL